MYRVKIKNTLEKIYYAITVQKKIAMTILTLDKVNLRARGITRGKKNCYLN